MSDFLLTKYNRLLDYLKELESVAIAFSGGVDSTFLLYAAKDALGEKTVALTARSCSFPKRELKEAVDYADKLGVRQIVVDTNELLVPGFKENPKDRCYICKRALFERMISVANDEGFKYFAEGSNLDDNGDYRPGLIAIKELGVKSPLRECDFSKAEIRELSKYFNIPTWDKPSYACLASRFPYGELITEEKLEMVDKGEQLLLDLGFKQFRVRIHGNVARIEVLPEEFDKMLDESLRKSIYDSFKKFGFSYVALDLLGYRTGSMNEVLKL